MKHAIDFFHAVENKNFFKDIPLIVEKNYIFKSQKNNYDFSGCVAKMMFSACDMGAWAVNIETQELFITERLAEILGYNQNDLKNINIQTLKNSIHPEDLEVLENSLLYHINGEHENINSLIRVQDKNKNWIKLYLKGKILFEDNNSSKWLFGVVITMDELANYYEEIKDLANYDSLTNLPNRKFLIEKLTSAIEKTQSDEKIAICFIDLDGFKSINDTYGHLMGDKFLCEIAKSLKKTIRSHDLVARLGGDEFVVVFNRIKDNEILATLLERLAKACHKNITINNQKFTASASIGVVLYPNILGSVEELISFADKSMYEAKFTKNQKYIIFNNSRDSLMDAKRKARIAHYAFKRLFAATEHWFK